jgi:hypothetical protein
MNTAELKAVYVALLSYVERLDRMGLYMDRQELQDELGYEEEEMEDLMDEREQLAHAVQNVSNILKGGIDR